MKSSKIAHALNNNKHSFDHFYRMIQKRQGFFEGEPKCFDFLKNLFVQGALFQELYFQLNHIFETLILDEGQIRYAR